MANLITAERIQNCMRELFAYDITTDRMHARYDLLFDRPHRERQLTIDFRVDLWRKKHREWLIRRQVERIRVRAGRLFLEAAEREGLLKANLKRLDRPYGYELPKFSGAGLR